MLIHRYAKVLPWLIPLGFGIILCLAAPLRSTLLFDQDEGYELMKSFLVSRGHPLYREFWNDQPPLHTELLASLFKAFGPSALVGRLLNVGFAMLLVGAMYQIVQKQSGRVAGVTAVVLLVSSVSFLHLSVSVMLELPAMSLALAAVWSWIKYFDTHDRKWLLISGALFGCALQVKLTAIIFAPALAMDLLIRHVRGPWSVVVSPLPSAELRVESVEYSAFCIS